MAKKDKALENAQRIWKEKTAQNKEKKAKATVPEVGKAQAEILSCFLGKDHFKNKAYEFELKIVGGVNMDRTFTKHIGLECKEPPEGYTENDIVGWNMDALDKLGVASPERDDVECLEGAIVNISFHRSKGKSADKWPNIYFNSVDTPAPSEDAAGDEVVDDEFDYIDAVN